MSQASSNSNRNPTARRRVAQACGTCRSRKVRCDAGIPKCALCDSLNIDCVYLDPEAQRIDPNTRLLLDRIQKLEDRIFASPTQPISIPSGDQPSTIPVVHSPRQNESIGTPESRTVAALDAGNALQEESLTLPTIHNANTTNLYQWMVVQNLLSEVGMTYSADSRRSDLPEATDIFLLSDLGEVPGDEVRSWHLFRDATSGGTNHLDGPNDTEGSFGSQLDYFNDLVREFFINVHVFYPILSQSEAHDMLQIVAESEYYKSYNARQLTGTKYCLLLMVLCLGSVAMERANLIYSNGLRRSTTSPGVDSSFRRLSHGSESEFWSKAKLLLGAVAFDDGIEAAQCFALSSIYLGSKGRALDSHQQIHLAARKVGILAKRTVLRSEGTPVFSDSFCRLFWVIYLYESDFAMELSITPPSGITRYEDMVQYPASEQTGEDYSSPMSMDTSSPSGYSDRSTRPRYSTDSNLVAFQISTNSAIRRFLNRITAVIYNPHEAWRKQYQTTYVNWLLKITNELQNHHEAIHSNLPPFLLSTDARTFWHGEPGRATSAADNREFTNHLWNVSRLRGRYCAGQYLICRPSFEFVLLNPDVVSTHPRGQEILDKCRSCINSCVNFVRIFSVEPANSMTSLFATGMATFAMVIILMISTTSPQFQQIVPSDIEEIISIGQQNLKRFGLSVREFEWHLQELEKLDRARKARKAENTSSSEMLVSD
ncbi:hypothetical protein IFR05_016116 [Cadophora sp. M221]|nr:hypothetical protein IFR05_016116 [Cadophora sp. M221]